MQLKITCWRCKGLFVFDVDDKGYEEYQDGKLIQVALPELSISNRELMISETCGECFDRMFDMDEE